MDRQPDPIQTLRYSQTCSAISRDNLFIKLMARDQELGKQISALTEQRIEIVALIRAIQWQRECGLIQAEGSHEHSTPLRSESPSADRKKA